jgi:hypothetical protein
VTEALNGLLFPEPGVRTTEVLKPENAVALGSAEKRDSDQSTDCLFPFSPRLPNDSDIRGTSPSVKRGGPSSETGVAVLDDEVEVLVA